MSRVAVFAGQGAQFVGMGKDLAEAYPECQTIFQRADAVLGRPLSRLCFEGPIEELTRSDNCQPAIFTMSVACHAAFLRHDPSPGFVAMAGLSLGEWTALHVAGALTFDDAIRTLEARGRFMQEACEATEGTMLSVLGMSLAHVETIARESAVEVANLNAPEQVVLSGPRERIAEAEQRAKAAGAKRTVRLNVAGAFHSSLMAPAAERLAEVLKSVPIQPPRIPVMSNVTGKPHGCPDDIRRDLVRQVTSSVRWVDCVQALQSFGGEEVIEFGPGRVLAGLIRQIHRQAVIVSIQDVATLQKAVGGDRSSEPPPPT